MHDVGTGRGFAEQLKVDIVVIMGTLAILERFCQFLTRLSELRESFSAEPEITKWLIS